MEGMALNTGSWEKTMERGNVDCRVPAYYNKRLLNCQAVANIDLPPYNRVVLFVNKSRFFKIKMHVFSRR